MNIFVKMPLDTLLQVPAPCGAFEGGLKEEGKMFQTKVVELFNLMNGVSFTNPTQKLRLESLKWMKKRRFPAVFVF